MAGNHFMKDKGIFLRKLKKRMNRNGNLAFLVCCVGALCVGFMQCNTQNSSVDVPDNINFNFDVRPILVRNCYLCHGPDPSGRKVDLRLDTYEGATALRDEGIKAVVPGSLRKSELIRRITHEDPEIVMPPPETNLKLSDYDIAVLKKWIDQGATWTPHWSFIPPEYVEPKKFDEEESANKIDDYILEKINAKGLEPAAEANAHSLLRRVSYILTGLPPTAKMIEQFVSDESSDAYEKIVDHYLNTNAYGERWARHWMDVVRYAETKGHEFDFQITGAWKYRDYLIRAFNDDIPYNQMVKEQLAGDLLDSMRWNSETGLNESQIGTMFYNFSEGKHSPVDTRKDEADRVDNMIDVTSKAFQGLTVSCARCHDHKFDPIPTADYYALYGVMQSSRFSPVSANLSKEKMKSLEEIVSIKKAIRKEISDVWQSTDLGLINKLDHESAYKKNIITTDTFDMIGDFRGQDLDGWRSDGMAFGQRSTLGNPVFDEDNSRLIRLESGKASSRTLSTGIYGAVRSPNFIIDKDFIGIRALGKKATIRIIIDNFQLIQNPIYGELDVKINSSTMANIDINISPWKGHKAYIEIYPGTYKSHEYRLTTDAFVEVEYAIAFNGAWPKMVDNNDVLQGDVQDVIAKWSSNANTINQVEYLNGLLSKNTLERHFPELDQLRIAAKKSSGKLIDTTFYYGIYDGFGIDSYVFNRGNTDDLSEEKVPRGFLSILSEEHAPFTSNGSGRLELAEAILNPENPLTSRVMVNRIWHHLFGRGIVETVDNFGLQGKLPSHPELLDHLALKFVEDGWSIKQMIKYVVMSKAFRRTVHGAADVETKDPDNLLLSHFPVRRLEAESIHDGMLAAADNLNQEMYGPPVPVYLTQFMQGRGRPKVSGPLDGNGRRNIYHEVRRNFLEPMMLAFDRPIPFTTFGNRNVTNVPAQSLILMNDDFVNEQAKALAANVIGHKEMSHAERLKYIYIKTLSREPSEEEVASALAFIQVLAQSYKLKDAEVADSIDVWKDYCHSVFNLKEFIYLI